MESILCAIRYGNATRSLGIISFLGFILSASLNAQTIVGTWQATLPIQKDPRIALKIIQATDHPLVASLTFIDHDNEPAPIPSIIFAPPELKFSVGDVSYSGKLSADGKSLTGLWLRGNEKYPLTFILATPATAWAYSGPARLTPMLKAADPTFEVATIKPSQSDAKQKSIETRFRIFKAKNATGLDLIRFAYHLTARQVEGGPEWMKELRFDVVGQPDLEGLPDEDQHRLMMRKLLSERFHLIVHDTLPIFPVYALTVTGLHDQVKTIAPNSARETKIIVTEKQSGTTDAQFVYTTIANFEDTLMSFIKDRQIVDETGLTGRFDIILTIPSEVLKDSSLDEGERTAAFFKAVQADGFQLKPKNEPLRVVVIDNIEQPTPN